MNEKMALGIAYLYTVINFMFSLLGRVGILAYGLDSESLRNDIFLFIASSLWLIVSVALVFVFRSLNRRNGLTLADVVKDSEMRKPAGMILVISFLLSLPSIAAQIISVYSTISSGRIFYSIGEITGPIFNALISVSQLPVGLYLINIKGKRAITSQNEETASASLSGTVTLYVLITFASVLLHKAVNIFFTKNYSFTTPWQLIIAAGIMLSTYLYIKRQAGDFAALLKDKAAEMSAGLLVIIDGLLDFTSAFMSDIMSYTALKQFPANSGITIDAEINLLKYILLLLIPILQILIGVYLLRHSKAKA